MYEAKAHCNRSAPFKVWTLNRWSPKLDRDYLYEVVT